MNYEEDYYEEDEREEKKHKSGWMQSFKNLLGKNEEDEYEEDEYEENEETPRRKKTISIWTDIKSLDDAKQIIDNLKNGEEQIVNFENNDDDTENDLRYFLYGAVYSLSGSIDSISKSSILIAPKGISIEKPDSKIRRNSLVGAFRVNG